MVARQDPSVLETANRNDQDHLYNCCCFCFVFFLNLNRTGKKLGENKKGKAPKQVYR